MLVEAVNQKKVQFKLNKQTSFEIGAEEAYVEEAEASATAVCCIGCNTGTGTTSGCPDEN